MEWQAAALTDRGRKRPGNEDSHLVRPDLGLFIVADGMGGHAAGEVASRIAVETFERELSNLPQRNGKLSTADVLRAAAWHANLAILEHATEHPETDGMGTTLTALHLRPERRTAWLVHVGDSRLYRFREGELRQITRDHTWVQEQIEQGALTPRGARKHPLSSVLTRAVGTTDELELDVQQVDVRPGDLLLLCSDGLTTVVDDRDLAAILSDDAPLDQLAARLIQNANLRGGPDNITVILLRAAA